jgi:hypothetical protein
MPPARPQAPGPGPTLTLSSPVQASRCVLRSTNTCCLGSPRRRVPYLRERPWAARIRGARIRPVRAAREDCPWEATRLYGGCIDTGKARPCYGRGGPSRALA